MNVLCCVGIWCDCYNLYVVFFFFFKQKTAYEMRISDWSSDVCSSDLAAEVNDGRYLESDGKSGPPSWANDEQMQHDFATGVQILSGPDGLSPEADRKSVV